MARIVQSAWTRWRVIGEAFGDLIGRSFAVLFYFTVFVPFALGVRLLGDPLGLRRRTDHWLERAPVGTSLDDARRQF